MKNFEKSIEELKNIIEKLEDGNIPLAKSLSLFEDGIKILNAANKKLNEMQKKVEILVKDADEQVKKENFEIED